MSRSARIVAVVTGLVLLAAAAVVAARAAAVALGATWDWPQPSWWRGLIADPSWGTTGVAAAVAAAAAGVLLVLAARQLGGRRRGSPQVAFVATDGVAHLDVHALERALARSLTLALPGARAIRVELTRPGDDWWVKVETALPPQDLEEARHTACETLARYLDRIAGLRPVRVDLVVAGGLLAASEATDEGQ